MDRKESRERDLHCYAPFSDFLAKEVLPWLHRRFQVTSNPSHVTISGSSAGGLTAAYCAFRYPKLFGNVLSQSGSFWYSPGYLDSTPEYAKDHGWLTRQFAHSPKLPLRFYIEAGRFEFLMQIPDQRRMRDVLEAKGYSVTYSEYNGGHDYFNWRGTFGQALLRLVGKHQRRN